MQMSYYQTEAAKTAIYPEAGSGSVAAIAYLGLGLGEVGEIQGKIKKIIRDTGGVITDEQRIGLMKEAGDVLWYLAMLTKEIGIDLDAVAYQNLSKLGDRQRRGVLTGSGDER